MKRDKILRFPSTYSIGIVAVRAAGTTSGWSDFAEAQGLVRVSADYECALRIYYRINIDPSIFSALKPDDIAVFSWVSTSFATEEAVTHLHHLTGLHGLELWETDIGDVTLEHLRGLTNLRWLDIGSTKITDDGLRHVREFASLQSLSLLNDAVGDEGLRHLTSLDRLEHLDLMSTQVTDASLADIKKLLGLKSLRLCQTRISHAGYLELKRELPGCEIRYNDPHNA